jgi:hypothetical protein
MAISKTNPASTSTEGIVTIKISSTAVTATLPVPFPAGNYRVDTGFSGTLNIAILNASNTAVASFSFATSSFFTLAETASKVIISGPAAAVNGIVSFQQLQRGVAGTSIDTAWSSVTLANTTTHGAAGLEFVGNAAYIIGGNADGNYNTAGTTSTIEKYDFTTSTLSTVVTSSADLAGWVSTAVCGTDIYFITGYGVNGFTGTSGSGTQRLYKFSTTTNTVSTMAARPAWSKLNCLVANAAGTKIYSFGSWDSTATNLHAASYVYDVAGNSWSSILPMPSDFKDTDNLGRNDHLNLQNTDQILFFKHRQTSTSPSGKLWRYNISTNTYTQLDAAIGPEAYQTGGGLIRKSGAAYGIYVAAASGTATGTSPNNNFFDVCRRSILTGNPETVQNTNTLTQAPPGNGTQQGTKLAFNDTYVCYINTSTLGTFWYRPIDNFIYGLL